MLRWQSPRANGASSAGRAALRQRGERLARELRDVAASRVFGAAEAGAWKKATENGHAALYALGQCPQSSTGASTSSVSSGVSQTAVSTTAVSTTAVSTTALSSTSGPSSTSATGSDPRSTSAAPETSTAPDSAGNDTPSLAESKAARQTLWGLFGQLGSQIELEIETHQDSSLKS